MGPNLRRLLELIKQYVLDKRSSEVRNQLQLIEHGLIDESIAEAYRFRYQPLIDEQKRRWNGTERVPELDEIYPHGLPGVIVGHCVEEPETPVGSFMQGPTFCIFAGTTGSGKTVAIRRFILEADESNGSKNQPTSFIIVDRKQDYQDLPDQLGSRWLRFDAHGDLRLALQPPFGVPVNAWINNISTLFSARAGLVSSWVTFANILRWLVPVLNNPPAEPLKCPDFGLLVEVTDRLPARSFAEKDTYWGSLRQVLHGAHLASSQLFKAQCGLDLERDIISQGRSAVISMPNIDPPWLGHFVIDLLISQVLYSRIHRGRRMDDPEVVFVFDEADDIVSRGAEAVFPQGSLSPLTKILRLGREFGIGAILGMGMLGSANPQILNAANHHYLFKMSDTNCRIAAARTLDLPRGADAIIPALEPGECLVRVPGPWPHAMLAKCNYVAPCRELSSEYDVHSFVPAKALRDLPEVRKAIDEVAQRHREAEKRRAATKHAALRAQSRQLLNLASLQPYWPVARLIDQMSPSPSPMARKDLLEELRKSEYAELKDVRIGSKTMCLIRLKDAAWQLLGKPPVKLRGRGAIEHVTFANWIRMVGEQRGYEAICEWRVPGTGHAVDAAWRSGELWEVFEVAVTCDTNLVQHIKACLCPPAFDVERVTIVTSQKSQLKTLQKKLEPFLLDIGLSERVEFAVVEVFEQELWSK